MDENRDSAGRRPAHRHVIRWAAGAAAVAVLAGGAAALASSGGSAAPAPSSQASTLDAVLSSAGAPTSAELAAASPRLHRLRWLIRGEHGQVTVRAKGGTTKTLAFERGKVTAVSGTEVTVAAADGTTWTWHLVSDSVIRAGGKKVSASDLAAGQQVFAGGPVVSGADDARLIVIGPPAPAASAARG